jgi:hypothetical protein
VTLQHDDKAARVWAKAAYPLPRGHDEDGEASSWSCNNVVTTVKPGGPPCLRFQSERFFF